MGGWTSRNIRIISTWKAIDAEYKEIDWEQRRYEIAKSIMTTTMTNSNFSINNPKYFAGLVVSYTDALIEELKK